MTNIFSELKEFKRLEEISKVLIKHELGHLISEVHEKKKINKKIVISPTLLREILGELGGTFVKLGQFLSLRADLIPLEYCNELSKLQDNVKSFEAKKAKEILRKEIGKANYEKIIHFEEKPIHAASIGQVHKAILKDKEKIAIKIMRPGIKELMMTDTLILYQIVSIIQKRTKQKIFDPTEIIEEFKRYTEKELNYLDELQAIKKTRTNFKEIETIKIPFVKEELSTEKILTMEFLTGESLKEGNKKLTQTKKTNIAKELIHVTLKQIFIDGYFHADLHPGNIQLINKGEKIGLLDFGIMGIIDNKTKEQLVVFLISLLNNDLDAVINSMRKLGFYEELKNEPKLKEDLYLTLQPYYDVGIEKMDLAKLFLSCLNVAKENNLKVPTNLMLVGKTIITLKGVVQILDKNLNIITVLKPFVGELIRKKTNITFLLKEIKLKGTDIATFLTELPTMTEKYFITTKKIETDLGNITKEMGLLTNEIGMVSRGFMYTFIIAIITGFEIIIYGKEPTIYGINIIGLALLPIILYFIWHLIRIGKVRFD